MGSEIACSGVIFRRSRPAAAMQIACICPVAAADSSLLSRVGTLPRNVATLHPSDDRSCAARLGLLVPTTNSESASSSPCTTRSMAFWVAELEHTSTSCGSARSGTAATASPGVGAVAMSL